MGPLSITKEAFGSLVRERWDEVPPGGCAMVPIAASALSDQLTPVVAYRRLVRPDARLDPSFLFESVEGGDRAGRYSILGVRPSVEVIAREHQVEVHDHLAGTILEPAHHEADPLLVPRRVSSRWALIEAAERRGLPACLPGGWVGYASYDTVRYAEPGKLPFASAPPDDRDIPDLHFCFYDGVVVFDQTTKLVHAVRLARVKALDEVNEAYDRAAAAVRDTLATIEAPTPPLPFGAGDDGVRPTMPPSNMTRAHHAEMVERCREYIAAGDIFQVVVGQRFRKESEADPFNVYRALRATNPSPYMVYLQCAGCVLVASSPEILCRVERRGAGDRVVTNRPLAGTRRRGCTTAEDRALAAQLLADPKERAEHTMLVDLGRNDVGRVARPGSVSLDATFEIERYSHVMHISSTVTGVLRDELDCWDALRSTLPVGTVSGAPKVRAMQIIDEVEPVRRGPYGGGFGYVTLSGEMDIALALRTVVVQPVTDDGGGPGPWRYDFQAAGGIVMDSEAGAEFDETVNKASAMVRSLELVERVFTDDPSTVG
ncbi:MAG: chorismate-binding protein [Planctomycetota bacterium]